MFSFKLHILLFLLVCVVTIFPSSIFAASSWYYPLDNYAARGMVKGFGQYIDDAFYKGKEKLFPYNRFYGYHTAIDLETFSDEKEKDIPVYAVGPGVISYVGTLEGYGGVILERLEGTSDTALYGHLRVSDAPVKVGTKITNKPTIIAYLGKEFSTETSGERKHLHFGVYKGQDNYFHGHEATKKELLSRWYDPTDYLKEKGAVSPVSAIQTPTPSSQPTKSASKPTQNQNLFSSLWQWLISLLKH